MNSYGEPKVNIMSYQNNRILVTGALGHVGRLVAKRLIHMGFHVNCLDIEEQIIRNQELWNDLGDNPRCNLYTGSITDKECINKAVADCSAVINLAGRLVRQDDADSIFRMLSVNIFGIENILKAMVYSNCKIMILATYGDYSSLSTDKDGCVEPLMASKIAAEAYCNAYKKKYDIQSYFIRSGIVIPASPSEYDIELINRLGFNDYKEYIKSTVRSHQVLDFTSPDKLSDDVCKSALKIINNK